jgi:hypothetical protein
MTGRHAAIASTDQTAACRQFVLLPVKKARHVPGRAKERFLGIA